MKDRSLLPYAAFIACALIWGSTFLAIRFGNDSLAPLWACSLRLALAALLLNGWLLATRQSWPKGKGLAVAIQFGVSEFGISLPLLYWGEKTVDSGVAAVLFATCPIVAMFEARLLGFELLNLKKLRAGLVAILGVGIVFWQEVLHGRSTFAMIAIFLAAAAATLAGLLLQRGPKQSPVAVNAVGTLVALPFALAASFCLGESHAVPKTVPEIFPVVYLTVFGSMGAFVLFSWLLNQWKMTTASFLGVLVPVIAVVNGAIFLGERLDATSGVGALLVVAGVILALRTDVKPAESGARPEA